MGWFNKITGSNGLGWFENKFSSSTPSSAWKSIQHWFTGKTQTDNSAKAQVWASEQLNEQQKDLDLWRAANLPSAQKEGYRAAGLNPILMGSQSPSVVSSHQASVGTGSAQNPMSLIGGVGELINAAKEYKTLKDEVRGVSAEADSAVYDSHNSLYQAQMSRENSTVNAIQQGAYIEATTGLRSERVSAMLGAGDDKVSEKAYNSLVQGIRNAIERGEYLNSRGHAVFEDVVTSGKEGARAFGTIKGAFKPVRKVK